MQKTIKESFSLEGVGLHTGQHVKVVLKPGEVGQGIVFRRVDLPNGPEIKADYHHVLTNQDSPRCTSVGSGPITIQTIEHLMAVLRGLGIDNLVVEINGAELPGLDGSALEFLKGIKHAGVVEQVAEKTPFAVKEPIWIERDGSSISIVPATDFKISYILDYNHPFLRTQFFSITLDSNTFESELASCRTFCLEEEAELLKSRGLGKGANFHNTLVVGKNGVKDNKVRFDNEFARHKVLDMIGDLYLLGAPLLGHVVAVKSGHSLNFQLLKKIIAQKEKYETDKEVIPFALEQKTVLDISEIMRILPHRYPFLLVDRIVELEKGKRAVGIKNLTINELFFQGHFPTRPVMPGVLMIEAMAQVGGIAVLAEGQNQGKVPIFMSINNVKFRRIVSPGDQLVMEAVVVKKKSKVAQIHAEAKVQGQLVIEADMMFSYVEETLLNS